MLSTSDSFAFRLVAQSTLARKLLQLAVQLLCVIAWSTENGTTTAEQWVLDAARTSRTCSLLLLDLPGRTGHQAAVEGVVRALALGGQETLHVQVDGVVVGLDAKHRIIQIHRLLRLGSFAAVNVEFHYASGLRMMTVEPLWPGTPLHHKQTFFRHDFQHLEVFDGHTGVAHLTCHAHALEDTCWRRGRTNGTRCTQTVVLPWVA